MISLLAINKAICTLYQQALDAAGTGAKLVAEDVSAPIVRPSGKVELEDGSHARLFHSGQERVVTFRLYYFAADGKMTTGWQKVDGSWYFLQKDGKMVAGAWYSIDGKSYYFNGSGKLLTNTTINGYKVGPDGAWIGS